MNDKKEIKQFCVYFDKDGKRTGHVEPIKGEWTISQFVETSKAKAYENEVFFATTTDPEKKHLTSQKFKVS